MVSWTIAARTACAPAASFLPPLPHQEAPVVPSRPYPAGLGQRSCHEAGRCSIGQQSRPNRVLLKNLESVPLPKWNRSCHCNERHASEPSRPGLADKTVDHPHSGTGSSCVIRQCDVVDMEGVRLCWQLFQPGVELGRSPEQPGMTDGVAQDALSAIDHEAARRVEPQPLGKDARTLGVVRVNPVSDTYDLREIGLCHPSPTIHPVCFHARTLCRTRSASR